MARILVIDDDEASRGILKEMLDGAGHEILEATNGEEGLQRYGEEMPDLVVTDLFLPPEGGLEVIRTLRAGYPEAKIIAISGVDVRHELDTVAHAVRYGAARAFNKPVEPEKLKAAIDELMAEGA